MVRLDGPKDAEDDLWLRDKIDAANFGQRQSSHVVVWGGDNWSSGMWVQRTTALEILGSKKAMYRVHPLHLAHCGSRCLHCGVGCTELFWA